RDLPCLTRSRTHGISRSDVSVAPGTTEPAEPEVRTGPCEAPRAGGRNRPSTRDHEISALRSGFSWYDSGPVIERPGLLGSIRSALRRSPVVVLTGPRQAGKTTLARSLLADDSPRYFDLESPTSLARLEEPMTALG